MSNRRLPGLILALSCVMSSGWSARQERDPFVPLLPTVCVESDLPAQWQFRGVIGTALKWHGWMVAPTGEWQRLRIGEVLVPGSAEVVALNAQALLARLPAVSPDCPAQEIHFLLAGE